MAAALAVAAGCGADDGRSGSGGGRCELPAGVPSMARLWNDAALDAIRLDFPAPTVHARNLFHLSAAMWDAWRAFGEPTGSAVFVDVVGDAADVEGARADAIAFASYRVLSHRYELSLARVETRDRLQATLEEACDVADAEGFVAARPDSAAALGWSVGEQVIESTFDDGALERRAYENVEYDPVNPPLEVAESGAGDVVDPDRWQPLLLEVALSQNGLPLPGGEQTFIGSNWGDVATFVESDDGFDVVPPAAFSDPPPPPRIADPDTADEYREQAVDVVAASGDLQTGEAEIDISPGVYGDNNLGVDDGAGHEVNPFTGEPYASNVVDAADYYRAIAEYWADGPTSETPPGHWNSLANAVSDLLAPDERRIGGSGDALDRLAWDVHVGLALNGALHDAAVAAWGTKAHYDSVRPITMIRWMSGNGAFDAVANPSGVPLEEGVVEVITDDSSAAGGRHEHLADHVGEIAVRAWLGTPDDPEVDTAGVDWMLGVDWVPYQRATFVTPAFASYVSGHSTFSRAGAEVLAALTGSPFFPGGMYRHEVPAGSFLHEEGPSETFELQWATYFDASDEAGRSRIWGGIHIEADDREGRELGSEVGRAAVVRAMEIYG